MASFVYVMATLAAAPMLLSRRLRELPVAAVVLPVVVILMAAKYTLGYDITWATLPITLLEIVAVLATQLLARRLALNTDEFAESTAELVGLMSHGNVPDIKAVESAVQQEMSRARRTGRPATLAEVEIHGQWDSVALRRFLAQLTDEIVQRSAVNQVGRLLLSATKGSDIVARDHDRFTLLLPETNRQQALQLIERLATLVEDQTALKLHSRSISFPDDELTLEGLRDRIREAAFTGCESWVIAMPQYDGGNDGKGERSVQQMIGSPA
jgi:GGDEF domain-containing protein